MTDRKINECKANENFYLFDKGIKKGTVLFISEPYEDGGTTRHERRFYKRFVFDENLEKLGIIPTEVFNEIKGFLDFTK